MTATELSFSYRVGGREHPHVAATHTAAGLESWPNVTGGKGIHLMAPLTANVILLTKVDCRRRAENISDWEHTAPAEV